MADYRARVTNGFWLTAKAGALRRSARSAWRPGLSLFVSLVVLSMGMTDPALARRAAPKGAPRRDKRAGQATARNAAAVARAEAARRQGDRVTIVGARGISPALSAAAIAAAAKVGAKSTIVNAGTLDLYDQRRFSGSAKIRTPIATTVRTTTTTALAPVTSTAAENTEPTATNSQTAGSVRSPILLITTTTVHEVLEIPVTPLSAEAVDPAAATALFGPEVGNTLAAGRAVLGETSANLRKAKVGDELRFIDWRGAELLLTVGAIVPDQKASNVEVLIPDVVAANAGSLRPQAVVIWNIPSRAQLNKELSSLPHNQVFRIRHSWDPPNVDAVLPAGDVKQLLGEFAITRHPSGLSLDAGWMGKNLVRAQLPLIGAFTCHKVVAAAARAALIEIQQRYLDGLINGPDSHRGGCFGAREIRTNVGTSGHDLSRHAWGAAIDLNPSTNGFGARPSIDPRIVEVFRRHGFAWGGSFMIPDGIDRKSVV